jgi:lantibiotic modifying enzyme
MIDIVKEIANRMVDPAKVNQAVFHSFGKYVDHSSFNWNPLSLSQGYLGLLIFFSMLDGLYPQEGWDKVSHRYILLIKESIEKKKISDFSLFGGLAGICYAITQASQDRSRYQKILHTLNQHLYQEVRKFFFPFLYEKIDLNIPIPPASYDLISGVCGIGIYLLENRSCPEANGLLEEILKIVLLLTKDIKLSSYELPGWYIPRHFQFNEQDRELFKKGNFNLSTMHGVTGILGFLSIAALKGVIIEGQIQAIQKLVDWLLSKRREKDRIVFWKSQISFEEEVLRIPHESFAPSYETWCRGSLSIARTLLLAGKVTHNVDLQETALHIFLKRVKNYSVEQSQTPTFCFGLAGILTMTKVMMQDTQSSDLSRVVIELEQSLVKVYQPDYAFGFQDQEHKSDHLKIINLPTPFSSLKEEAQQSNLLQLDKIGILDGVAGILLSLIYKPSHSWPSLFLIS